MVCSYSEKLTKYAYFPLRRRLLVSCRHGDAVRTCSLALALDGGSVKALMRRSSAQEALDDVEAALADAQKVAELDPSTCVPTWPVRGRCFQAARGEEGWALALHSLLRLLQWIAPEQC